MSISVNQYHLEYGRHSNISDCCIEYWVTRFDSRDEEYRTLQILTEYKLRKQFGYRPCVNCMKNLNWYEIHLCTIGCLDFLLDLHKRYKNNSDASWIKEHLIQKENRQRSKRAARRK